MEKNNFPFDILCKDIPYNLNYLRNVNENLEWDVYCKIMSNTRLIWNDDDYIRLGTEIVQWRVFPVLSAMVGFFLNVKEVYKLMTDSRRGIGTQYFRCIVQTFKEIDENHLEISLELPVGYQYCSEFFLMTKGFFIACPMLLKLGHSNVVMHKTDRGTTYNITYPQSSDILSWIRKIFALPYSKKAGMRELNETYELLYDRYNQLEENRTKIHNQAKQLETAYSISQLIRSDLDLDFTLRAVVESLINVAGFAAVEVIIDTIMDGESVKRFVQSGNSPAGLTPLNRMLEGHGHKIGKIILWPHPNVHIEDTEQLLDYVVPTISMEILNALSFKL
jgi:hypothetical protein